MPASLVQGDAAPCAGHRLQSYLQFQRMFHPVAVCKLTGSGPLLCFPCFLARVAGVAIMWPFCWCMGSWVYVFEGLKDDSL